MMMEYSKIWRKCLTFIKKEVESSDYMQWFEPIIPIKYSDYTLTIQVPSKLFYHTLEDLYFDVLANSLTKVIGENASLEYQIRTVANPKQKKRSIQSNKELPKIPDSEVIKNPFVIPGIQKVNVDSQLNNNCIFDSYIVGQCNQLAVSAGHAIAEKPGGTAFNPLLIYGDVGLGKTHLAQAIGNRTRGIDKNKQVLYVTTERFTNQVIQSIKKQSVSDFMNFYQMIDVLIVDDIHFLANRPKTQEIFFNIFNHLHQNQKQIILTCDRPPKDLKDVDLRLISRFKWGLGAELTVPSYDTRMKILDYKTRKDGIELSHEIKEYICYNIKNNIRELEGVVITLVAQATLNKKEIDMELAQSVVNQFISQVNKGITVENIKQLVANYFEVPIESLHSPTRKRNIVIARQLSMYLAKNYTNSSLKVIGNNFGGRDHSTVIYSVKAIQDLMDTDSMFKDTVSDLEKQVKLTLH